MPVAFLLVLTVGGYAVLTWIKTQKAIQQSLANRANVPGVSVYQPIAIPQRAQQLYAYSVTNPDQSVQPGYAPALGPFENQGTGVIF